MSSNNPGGVADAVLRLARDVRLRRTLVEGAGRHVRAEFRGVECAGKLESIFREEVEHGDSGWRVGGASPHAW